MKTPSPTWQTEYRHDRRAHRHRCRCCNRILNEGDQVIMTRAGNKTVAIHAECASKPHTPGRWTWADVMLAWGIEHLRAQGFKVDLHPMSCPA